MTNETPNAPRRRNNALLEPVEDAARGVARFGYGLLLFSLGLLPKQSRQHMHNAVRELSYAFASLPRDFADIAGSEIERWAKAAPAEPTPRVQHITVIDETNAHAKTQAMTRLSVAPTAPDPVTRLGAAAAPPAPAFPVAPAPSIAPPMSLNPAASAPAASAPLPAPTPAPAAPEAKAAAPAASAPAASAPASSAPTAPIPAMPIEAPAGITIAHLEYNPSGRDRDGEYVLIRNSGSSSVDMTGWKLSDHGNQHTFTFPRFRLAPGAEVKLWTRSGSANAGNLYWANRGAVWNNSGDTATLKDAAGVVITSYSYQGKVKK